MQFRKAITLREDVSWRVSKMIVCNYSYYRNKTNEYR